MKKQLPGYIAGILTMVLIGSLSAGALAYQKQATLDYPGVRITLDGKEIIPTDANGNTVEPFVIDGTTYLPVRGIANALGLGVEWDGANQTVVLSSTKNAPTVNWDSQYKAGSISYKIPSVWSPQTKDGNQYFYFDKSLTGTKGMLMVQQSTITPTSSLSEANILFSAFGGELAESEMFKENFSMGSINSLNSSWYVVYSFTYNSLSGRAIAFLANDNFVIFSFFVPDGYEISADECVASLITTISIDASDVTEKTLSYSERLSAVLERWSNGERITYEKYSKVKTGMSYIDVAEIIGDLGTTTAESENITIRQWKSADNGIASITFVDGKVSSKSQVGL